jgi:hypothetical protein
VPLIDDLRTSGSAHTQQNRTLQRFNRACAGLGLANDSELPPNDPRPTTFAFPLTVSPRASACLKHPEGVVIDHTLGNIENLEVIVRNLPPNTDFVLFVI